MFRTATKEQNREMAVFDKEIAEKFGEKSTDNLTGQ